MAYHTEAPQLAEKSSGNCSAELFFFPAECTSGRHAVALTETRGGFWKRPRPKRLPWLTISLLFSLADFVVSLLAGPLAFVLAGTLAGFDALDCALVGMAPVLTLATFYERGLYSRSALSQPLKAGLRQVTLGWMQAFGLLLLAAAVWSAAAEWGTPDAGMSSILARFGRSWTISALVIGLSGLLATRASWSAMRRHLVGQVLVHERAVVVGAGPEAEQVIGQLRDDPALGLEVVGVLDDGARREQASLCGVPILGGIGDIAPVARRSEVDTIIVALPWAATGRIAAAVAAAERLPIDIRLVPDIAAQQYLRYPRNAVAGHLLLDVRGVPISGIKAVVKRAEDIVLASLALLVLAPVLLLIAAAIKLDSRGPVFFKQPRHGFNNRVFDLYKFRSMHAHLADVACARQTSRGDARLTRVGAFLRRHSLDELPQLLNVLRGEMSIIGPRPHALSTQAEGLPLEEALDSYVARFRVKPGITGWAQVNSWRGELDTREKLERRVAFDLDYIERWSLLLDLKILVRTFRCVLADAHAY